VRERERVNKTVLLFVVTHTVNPAWSLKLA